MLYDFEQHMLIKWTPLNVYTNLPKVFVQHKITLVVNVPLWTKIKSGAMIEIVIFKY